MLVTTLLQANNGSAAAEFPPSSATGWGLEQWVGIALAAAAVGQLVFAGLLWRVNSRLERMQADHFSSEGPRFRVYFNGFQNRPVRPANEMLTFQFTIANEGRADARIGFHEIQVLNPASPILRIVPTILPHENVERNNDGTPTYLPPTPSRGDYRIPAHDTRVFIAYIPAGAGYENWREIILKIEPVGGVTTQTNIDMAVLRS